MLGLDPLRARRDFIGAKAAFFCQGQILTYLRDDHPGLPWPGSWDLPGGGREGEESPEACLLRELSEEFGLLLSAHRLEHALCLPAMQGSGVSWFFAGHLQPEELAQIRFGDEGQYWQMMGVAEFLAHPQGIPPLQARVAQIWPRIQP